MSSSMNFNACELQGKLFLHDQINKALVRKNERQTDDDYGLPTGWSVKDECSRAFQIANASWKKLREISERTDLDPAALRGATEAFAQTFFRHVLGYAYEPQKERIMVGDRGFVVHALANELPVVIVPSNVALDETLSELAVLNGGHSRKTAFQAVQEFLNASSNHTWGFAFNGRHIRLVRDAVSLTRPSYLDFNLDEIFSAESFSDFLRLWAVLHASRTQVIDGLTAWDAWIKAGEDQGQPIRKRLSLHVTNALVTLGTGFLEEPSNEALRQAIESRRLTPEAYLRELLRLMYRFLFVFCLEERDLLHPAPQPEDQNTPEEVRKANRDLHLAVRRYQTGYALHRYRDLSTQRRFRNRYGDAWDSVRIVFRALNSGCPSLALPALGGLFASSNCPTLDGCSLSNKAFFEAMQLLRWATIDGVTAPVDYKNLGTEELGSIYEGLLELVPTIDVQKREFSFIGLSNAENERKSSGSYYTPDSLVQSLIKTALNPVIEATLAKNPKNPIKALLDLTVIDPTCGSGHFLLAAARRIAEVLAEKRATDGVVTPDGYREALRDVIRHCIYGVDLNPLSVELARMALWLEGFSRGKPLSFLDHHLKVGNSVLGVGNLEQLKFGIAATAFKPQMGDDAAVCKALNKTNKASLGALANTLSVVEEGSLFGEDDAIVGFGSLDELPSETLEDELRKETLFRETAEKLESSNSRQQCDVYMTAYLCPKTEATAQFVPTTKELGRLMTHSVQPEDRPKIQYASDFCRENRIFHWPLEFADVFRRGGFDCVLGNPPWEKPKVEDKKWFGTRLPAVADAQTAAIRQKMIDALADGTYHETYEGLAHSDELAERDRGIYRQYVEAQHQAAAGAVYGHLNANEGGRFPLTGWGDTNLYSYVTELMFSVRQPNGAVGVVTPSGLVTDDATKALTQKLLNGEISNLYQFDNTEKFFPIDSRYNFLLLTLRKSNSMESVFYASNIKHIDDPKRKVVFQKGDFLKFNPNTETCLSPRTPEDLHLLRRIYFQAQCVLENEGVANPWSMKTLRMFDMSLDSHLFSGTNATGNRVPLFEGKMIHQFDNRFASYDRNTNKKGEPISDYASQEQKQDTDYHVNPRYWVEPSEVQDRFKDRSGNYFWIKPWMLAFRDIASPTNQRTVICAVLPSTWGAGHKAPLILPDVSDKLAACLMATLNSFVIDFVDRIKQPGTNVCFFILKQLPVLPPERFSEAAQDYIASRVARLTKNDRVTAACWLPEYPSETYQEPRVRLQIRAELDAYIAHLYKLSRRDLEYILDPTSVCGEDHPSATFPGLKRDEIAEYGEFLTQRLVLEAYDELARTVFA